MDVKVSAYVCEGIGVWMWRYHRMDEKVSSYGCEGITVWMWRYQCMDVKVSAYGCEGISVWMLRLLGDFSHKIQKVNSADSANIKWISNVYIFL